jgi:hypothetical protein
MEKPTYCTDTHLEYLDDLRDSGVTNMFGAGAYLQKKFFINRAEAKEILLYWMESFETRHPV